VRVSSSGTSKVPLTTAGASATGPQSKTTESEG
jgi:hypothetical protein